MKLEMQLTLLTDILYVLIQSYNCVIIKSKESKNDLTL